MTAIVREARRTDLAQVTAIERLSFGDPWSRGMFHPYLLADSGALFLVASEGDRISGYAVTQTVADEAELLNIAVDPALRGQGIGALLLDVAMDRCARAGAAEMWLEVRSSNTDARSLYEGRGFAPMGVRKRYYDAPREDALVLHAALPRRSADRSIQRAVPGFAQGPDDPIPSPATHNTRQETK